MFLIAPHWTVAFHVDETMDEDRAILTM